MAKHLLIRRIKVIVEMANEVLKKKKTDRELCQIIASSITDIVRDSLNPTFRQTYFDIVQVKI